MPTLRSLLDSPVTALAAAARRVEKAKEDLAAGRLQRLEYNDLVRDAVDLRAIDQSMLSLEEKQALQDGLKALLAIAENV